MGADEQKNKRKIAKKILISSYVLSAQTRLTICRMRNRRFSKDIRAINFRFRKEDRQKLNKQRVLTFESL